MFITYCTNLCLPRKTQIALEYAYRRQAETSCSIFWVHADSQASFSQDYSDLARIAGVSLDLKGEDLLGAVKQWIENQRNWLLVLDNADDLKIFKKPYSASEDHQLLGPELLRFVPKSQTGTIIWTSRDGGICGNIIDIQRGIEVKAMTIEQARDLFQKLTGRSELMLSEDEDTLLELLQYLPLAIAQASAYIRKTKVSIKQYLTFLHESESRQLDLLSQEFPDVYRSGVPNSVIRTWIISMKQISKESSCSEKILNTITFFDHKGIPFELIKAAAGPTYSEDEILLAASRLTEYSFLQTQRVVDEGLPTYEQHRLVHLATRQTLSEAQVYSFSGEALRIMANLFPDGTYETWKSCIVYLPHALKASIWQNAEEYKYQAPVLLARIGCYYWAQGYSEKAEQLEIEVLELQKEILGPKHPDTIIAMANLTLTWWQQGYSKKAEQLQIEVLELRKEILGPKHPDTIIAMANLASTWWQQRYSEKAEQLQIEVLELQKEILGPKHPDTIIAMANLASTWWQQEYSKKAEQLQIEVLELRKEILGPKYPDTIRAMANLASTWRQQGYYKKAEQLEIEVLELRKEILGPKHPDTISAMANLASTWRQQGYYKKAEQLEIEVLELRKEILGPKHPDTILAMANLALTWQQQGYFEKAEQLQLEVLELRKEILGPKHPDTIRAMANLEDIKQQNISDIEELRSNNISSVALENLDSTQQEIISKKFHSRLRKWTRKVTSLGRPKN
jgi:hypothetical protein